MSETSLSNTKLNMSEYKLLQTLGLGAFGRVRIAKHNISGEYVAIKSCKKHEIIKIKQVDHI